MKSIYLIMACTLLQACTTLGSVDRPESYYQNNSSKSQDSLIRESLLGQNDKKLLSY